MVMNNSERIDKFLRGLMTPEENEAFMSDFNSNKELREETQITALMIKGLEERQSQEDAEVIEEVIQSKRKARIVSLVKRSMSIAAVFLFILLPVGRYGYTAYNNYKDDTFVSQNLAAFNPRSPRSESVVKELSELFSKINTEEDITPTIQKLQQIYDNIQAENDDYAQYNYFESTIARYLALAYVKSHSRDKAKEILRPWAEKGDEKATELLEKIDNL